MLILTKLHAFHGRGGSSTNVLEDNDASQKFGSERDKSVRRLSSISRLSLLGALISPITSSFW